MDKIIQKKLCDALKDRLIVGIALGEIINKDETLKGYYVIFMDAYLQALGKRFAELQNYGELAD